MKLAAIFAVAVIMLIAGLATGIGQIDWLGLARHGQELFVEHYLRHPLAVICGFFLAFTLVAALGLPGASLLMLLAGATFGLLWGTLLALLASTAGATLSMLAARHFLRGIAEARFGRRLAEINAGIERDGAYYLFGLRMAPVIPFAILNPLVGLTTMKTWTFFWVSALGMLAGTAAYVIADRELALADAPEALLSPGMLLALALLGVLPLIGKRLVPALRSQGPLAFSSLAAKVRQNGS